MSVLDSVRQEAAFRRVPPAKRAWSADASSAIALTTPATPNQRSLNDAGIDLSAIPACHLLTALTIRRTEERLLGLFSEGRVFGTVHTCIGQEWSAVAIGAALRPGDYLFSNHRGHGHYLARTDDVEGLVAEIMGRQSGPCGGRGGSQHLCRDGFFSNGIQGGIMPVSAGLGLGCRLRKTDDISAVCIGDGTFGEGVVYETMNLASKWRLPLLIIVEDNGIAQSTPLDITLAGSIEGRALAFDIAYFYGDTWDPVQLIRTAHRAARLVRHERRPAMLHIRTFRLKAHSKGDDDRSPETVDEYARRDVLNLLQEHPTPTMTKAIETIDARLDMAVDSAEQAPFTDHTAFEKNGTGSFYPAEFDRVRLVDGIREALHDALRDDPRVLILGEDVCDPYGGAFKVTVGLSARFPDRVFNTPISEAAIVGTGCGLALDGWLPVVEIMFGDFLLLAADQWVNHAAKLAWMYNDKVRVPMIVRTPMGGYRGYGPTHSQSLEKHLLGVPGTTVWALHHRHCPRCFYRNLLREVTGPALVLENKLLYARHATCETPPGWSLETFLPGTCETGGPPTGRGVSGGTMTRMRGPREPQLTLLAYGGMAPLAEAAAMQLWNQEELACELIFPVQLYPLTIEPIRASVERTGHLLIVEEGQGFAAWGSEVIAQLTEERQDSAFSHGLVTRSTHGTGIRISRVHAKACPIPGSRPAELQVLPSEAEIIAAGIHLVTR